MQPPQQSVYVFIDASNMWAAQKVKGRFIDLLKLKHYLQKRYSTNDVTIYYYDAYPAPGTRSQGADSKKHKFYTYLKKGLGIIVRKKPLKQIKIQTADGVITEEKGNMDVEMSIDAVSKLDKYDIAVFFSGDSDFLALVRYIKNHAREVHIYSSKNNVSTELRTGGDGYTDVLRIEDDIWGGTVHYRESRKAKK